MPQVYEVASSSIVDSLTALSTQITGAIGNIAPSALTVTGLFLIWKLGIKFFRGVAK